MSQISETAENAESFAWAGRPWRCTCGYMNAASARCGLCNAEAPPEAMHVPEPVGPQTWLTELWEQAQRDERVPYEQTAVEPNGTPWMEPVTPDSDVFVPEEPPGRRTVGRWVQIALAASICLVTVAGLAAWWLLPGGKTWPSHWDPRVASIAAFDEANRGLHFRHPVPVVFLSDAAFRQKVTGPAAATTAKDRADAQRVVEELRALGLTSGNPELISGARNLVGSDVEGFYDYNAKTVWVRGDVMTPHLKVVLAHELTHVLQDQNFGILHPKDDDADAAYTAVVEGDAVRMQNLYLKTLSPADQQAYADVENGVGSQASDATSSFPQALVDEQQFPYAVGPHFIDVIVAARGTSGINDALRTPPTSTIDIIEPSRYLAGDQPVVVAPPTVASGERRLEAPSTAGGFELFQILAARLDVGQAWRAASTWNGDSSIAYQAQGRTCIRLDVAAVVDPQPLQAALAAWVAAAHRGSVSRVNGNVRFDTCDPGPSASLPAQPSVGPLDALDIRGSLAQGIATSTKLQPPAVDCLADVLLEVAGNQGLQKLIDLSNNGDGAALVQYSASLGLQARPTFQTQCSSQQTTS